MDNNFIERIKKVKAEKKVTNEALAEMTGIPTSTLSKILAGLSYSPKFVNVMAIADALSMSYEYLIDGVADDSQDAEDDSLSAMYNRLDTHGREVIDTMMRLELARIENDSNDTVKKKTTATVLSPIRFESQAQPGKRKIRFFSELRASAGTGQYLSDDTTMVEEIMIPDIDKTKDADFVVAISGNSMEPIYHDGNMILVQSCDSVEPGELGLFVADGESYFKKYQGDYLESLNPDYQPIRLSQFEEIRCYGRVVGKLKKK